MFARPDIRGRSMRGAYVLGGVLLALVAGCRPGTGAGDGGVAGTSSSSSGGGGGLDGGASSSGGRSSSGMSRSSSRTNTSSSNGGTCGFDGENCTRGGNEIGQCCSGVCVSYADLDNCGTCGNACGSGEACVGGDCISQVCRPGSQYCITSDGGYATCCGSTCVNVQTSVLHCGNCYSPCETYETCSEGNCYVADCSAPGANGQTCFNGTNYGTCCGDVCINTYASTGHCGACGASCPQGTISCQSGNSCINAAGESQGCRVDGGCAAGETCVGYDRCLADTCTTALEGFDCAAAGNAQQAGRCCGEACLDILNNPDHCGACNNACSGSEYCLYGNCRPIPTCNAANNGTQCPVSDGVVGICCNGSCLDTRNTNEHCGACGTACPSGAVCTNGNCVTPDGGYGYCRNTAECPTDLTCVSGRCAKDDCGTGVTGVACAFGGLYGNVGAMGTCCGGDCVDPHQDGDHCGSCGNACPNNGLCVGDFFAQCLPTGTGNQCSGGSCFASNLACVNGWCVSSSCMGPGNLCAAVSGVGACCSQGFTFTCADVQSDTQNCGACGAKCDPGQACVAGACQGVAAPCGAENLGRFCGDATDAGNRPLCCAGGCKDLLSDPANCGYCGRSCNTGESCVNGACAFVECAGRSNGVTCFDGTAFGNCCAESCVDTETDENNCGQCTRRCAANAVCQRGRCGVTACTPDVAGSVCFNGDATGRCCGTECVDTTSDPRHCSGCGLACNTGESCVNSGCL